MLIKIKKVEIYECSCGKKHEKMNEALECCNNSSELNKIIHQYKRKFNRALSERPTNRSSEGMCKFYAEKIRKLRRVVEELKDKLSFFIERPFAIPSLSPTTSEMNKMIERIVDKKLECEGMVRNERTQEEKKLESLSREELIELILKKGKV